MKISDGAALTFDDVLMLPNYSDVNPSQTDTSTRLTPKIKLKVPLMSSAMDTVTESRLAIAMADQGGLGVLHKNMTIEAQAIEVRQVKKFESGVVRDPITVSPDTTIGELRKLGKSNQFSGFPVVKGKSLVGLITNRDYRFCVDEQQHASELMTPKEKLITVKESTQRAELLELFQKHRIEKLPMVNSKFELSGMITVKDMMKQQENPHSSKDEYGQLLVAAAVGTGEREHERVSALVGAGVDVIVVDTAHGYSKGVLEQVKWIKKNYPAVAIIAGNIATADAAIALAKAGADAVKVGMGPGSICTTRIVTGMGVPQITAINQVVQALKGSDVSVIADGGIRSCGDLCKAIATGADIVMIGGLFAGTDEAPGEQVFYKGRVYKAYRGMGSITAMSQGSADRYAQTDRAEEKMVPEGIEGRVAYKGALSQVVYQLVGGLQSSMGYLGANNIREMQDKARFIRVTAAGVRESHVHDVTITKEAPNYAVEETSK